jgi:maleamate amidohydrolase
MPEDGAALILIDVIDAFFSSRKPTHYPETATILDPLRQLPGRPGHRRRLIVHAVERHYPGLSCDPARLTSAGAQAARR